MSEQRYPMAPLIRFTLVSLYFALVFPLPWLAPSNLQPWLIGALPVGFLLVWALVSEEVSLNEAGLQVGYPRWCSWLLRRGWSLKWDQVKGLTPVATSQGGRVFYVRTEDGSAYLLPQRVQAFEGFLGQFSQKTGLDTRSIGRISPPWTYQLLAGLCLAMLVFEAMVGWALLSGRWELPAASLG